MFTNFWEDTSLYYFISTIFALICLTLTCLWNKKTINTSPNTTALQQTKINASSNGMIMSKIKPLQLAKEIEETLPQEVKLLEKKFETKQLEAIYKLMQKHSDQFGDTTMDDMKSQMQLYGF